MSDDNVRLLIMSAVPALATLGGLWIGFYWGKKK